jgi:hypothetical protein
VPLGHNLITNSTVCCDPINWFARAHLIGNPSAFILGLPALGKSTLIRRMLIGLAAQGVRPLVLADTKPDFSDLIRGLGGQVVRMGGTAALNILDPGQMGQAARRLPEGPRRELGEKIHQRRLDMITGLIVLMREGPVTDGERPLLSAALRALDAARPDRPPVLTDLLRLLQSPTGEMRAMTMDRGDDERYRAVADPLSVSLMTLTQGELGATFGHQTTTPLDLDAPAISVDISNIGTGSAKVRAAMMLASWNEGYAAVDAAKALADAGVAPQRRYILALDELWAVLRTGNGLVERVDALTRLNRNEGVGQIGCANRCMPSASSGKVVAARTVIWRRRYRMGRAGSGRERSDDRERPLRPDAVRRPPGPPPGLRGPGDCHRPRPTLRLDIEDLLRPPLSRRWCGVR